MPRHVGRVFEPDDGAAARLYGGRGWQVRVPAGATWLSLRDEGDPARGGGPEPAFGFGEPPLGDGAWEEAQACG